jgi:hypothetical protein
VIDGPIFESFRRMVTQVATAIAMPASPIRRGAHGST